MRQDEFDAHQTVAGTATNREKRGVMDTPVAHLDELARLLGDRSRAAMLEALMDGRHWTGRELANAAHVTPSTASLHLKRLIEGDIVSAVAHGRHKYYRIVRRDVGQALETLMALSVPVLPRHTSAMDATLRRLRMCYDHLAGMLAVKIAEHLVARGAIEHDDDQGRLTRDGVAYFAAIGIAIDTATGRRPLCKPCLDWSERRYHLAGRTGCAIARHALERAWVERQGATRALRITEHGRAGFAAAFGADVVR